MCKLAPPPRSSEAVGRASRFVALDGIRAVGALAVLTTHVGFNSGDSVNGRFAGFIGRLDVGVALFFVVSGFLLFRPHVIAHLDRGPRPALGRYFWRRIVRIVPVLWMAVVATWLLLRRDEDSGLYIAHALFVQIYVEDHHLHGLTQMWSLATEVSFYIVLPLIGWLLCRRWQGRAWIARVVPVLLVLCVISPAWMAATTSLGYDLPRLWLPAFIGWFAAGMALAVWSESRERGLVSTEAIDTLAGHTGTAWALAAGVFALATTSIAGPLDLTPPQPAEVAVKNVLYLLIATLVVLPCIPRGGTPSLGHRMLSGPPGRFLGDVSYGIFAYHVLVLVLLERLMGLQSFDGEFLARYVPTLVISVAVAGVSYYAIERRLMRWSRSPHLGLPRPDPPNATPSKQVQGRTPVH
jgi:peptidoglycan/LPS O-acetylase OafA/YrhL